MWYVPVVFPFVSILSQNHRDFQEKGLARPALIKPLRFFWFLSHLSCDTTGGGKNKTKQKEKKNY
jgi:hypothetical protein